jgi:hypothetical protein
MDDDTIHIVLIIFIIILLYKNQYDYFSNQSIAIFEGNDATYLDGGQYSADHIFPLYAQTTFRTLYDK